MTDESMKETETGLAKLPPAVAEAYRDALESMDSSFTPEELVLWAKEGLAIANQTVRSWESAVEYYRVGAQVARSLAFPSFMQWARCGTYLAQDSPTLAVSFFRSSPSIVSNLRPQYIPRWAGLGRSLYKGTWKSSTLAAKFFEISPDLIRNLPFWDVEVFASLIEALSFKSYDVAVECLVLGRDVLPAMGREREAFLSMARALTDSSWREVKSCLELAPKALQQIDEGQTGRFLKLGERLTKVGYEELLWPATGEVLNEELFNRYRAQGGIVVIHFIPDDAVEAAVVSPLTAIASDGWMIDGAGHPRTAGTYGRVLGRF